MVNFLNLLLSFILVIASAFSGLVASTPASNAPTSNLAAPMARKTKVPTPTPTQTPTPTIGPGPTATSTLAPTATATAAATATATSSGTYTFPNPADCANPGSFINYAQNCGAEWSATDPSPWIQLSPAWTGALRINNYYPPYAGVNDFAFSDGTMSSAAQTLGFGQCVNTSSIAALAPGNTVTFGGYYRVQLSPARLISLFVQITAFTDTACSTGPMVIGTSPTQNYFDHTWYSIYTYGVVPAGTQSIQVQVFHNYSSGSTVPDSAFWDNFLFYQGH